MKKKIAMLVMSALLVCSCAACGTEDPAPAGGDTEKQTEAVDTNTDGDTTEEVANKDKPLVWFNRQPSNSSTRRIGYGSSQFQ